MKIPLPSRWYSLLLAAFLALAVVCGPVARAASVTETVFNFATPPSSPIGELMVVADGTMYGTTSTGGGNGAGTIFTVGADGVARTLIEFSGNGPFNKGTGPAGTLLAASDGNIYGTTTRGGASNLGTVFMITPDGLLTTLAEFTGGGDTNRGSLPYAGLIDGGDGFLYGTTSRGGAGDAGTVIRVSLADHTVSTLIEFTGRAGLVRGSIPLGALVKASDGKLYGTTSQGGATGDGTVFSVATDGTFKPLISFTGLAGRKGSAPLGALVQATDGNLYGTTARGGAADNGTVFRLSLAGALVTIADFTGVGGTVRGAQPEAPLVAAADGTLYGTTFAGGRTNLGTIFKISAGRVVPVVDFTGATGARPGANPQSGLTLAANGDFYGTTFRGGVANAGTVFRLTTGGIQTKLVDFSSVNLNSFTQPGVILGNDGQIHGITSASGLGGKGSIFQITFTGEFTTAAEFTGQGTTIPGNLPRAPLVEGTDGFYGTTSKGGMDDFGTIFKIDHNGVFTTLAELSGNGATNKGATPRAALVPDGQGNFFGSTSEGGAANLGTMFKLAADGSVTTLVEFTGNGASNKGAMPLGALCPNSDKSLFYGTTAHGGAADYGTAFSLTPDGVLTTLAEFADSATGVKGAYPQAPLIIAGDGNLYGSTASGGATGNGTIFKMTPSGVITTLVELSDHRATNKGAFPYSALIECSDGQLYGTTRFGGTRGNGTVFKMTRGGVLTTLAELNYSTAVKDGAYPEAAFFLGSDGNIYTATTSGGTIGAGTVFRVRLRAATVKTEALNLMAGGVRLRARVQSGTLGGTVAFQYGTDIMYGALTPAQSLGGATADFILTADLAGLLPNTVYHYRTVSMDSSGPVYGPDATFTTDPLSTSVLAADDTVGGVSTTQIKDFGVPSVGHDGSIAVLANLTTATGASQAIMAGAPPVVVASKGGLAPKTGSSTAVFTSFGDPACDGAGHVAFSAKIVDGHIPGAGLWTNLSGSLEQVALVGGTDTGIAGTHYSAITSYAMSSSGTIFYTATFAIGARVAGTGLWAFDAAGSHLLLKTGDNANQQRIVSIAALTPVAGSPGQGRGYRESEAVARVTLADRSSALLRLSTQATPIVFVTSPLRLSIHLPFTFVQTFGPPSLGALGTSAFRGTTSNLPIIVGNLPAAGLDAIAQRGDDAPGIDGASFLNFLDPVYNAASVTAFVGTVYRGGVTASNNSGIWQTSATDGTLTLVARTGQEPPGVPQGAWSSFVSLALPDNGQPVFLAKIAPGPLQAGLPSGINATNNMGVWAVDATGAIRLLVRTGDTVLVNGAPKTVSILTLLSAVTGSPGQARSYNDAGDLVFRATLTDHKQAVMRLRLP